MRNSYRVDTALSSLKIKKIRWRRCKDCTERIQRNSKKAKRLPNLLKQKGQQAVMKLIKMKIHEFASLLCPLNQSEIAYSLQKNPSVRTSTWNNSLWNSILKIQASLQNLSATQTWDNSLKVLVNLWMPQLWETQMVDPKALALWALKTGMTQRKPSSSLIRPKKTVLRKKRQMFCMFVKPKAKSRENWRLPRRLTNSRSQWCTWICWSEMWILKPLKRNSRSFSSSMGLFQMWNLTLTVRWLSWVLKIARLLALPNSPALRFPSKIAICSSLTLNLAKLANFNRRRKWTRRLSKGTKWLYWVPRMQTSFPLLLPLECLWGNLRTLLNALCKNSMEVWRRDEVLLALRWDRPNLSSTTRMVRLWDSPSPITKISRMPLRILAIVASKIPFNATWSVNSSLWTSRLPIRCLWISNRCLMVNNRLRLILLRWTKNRRFMQTKFRRCSSRNFSRRLLRISVVKLWALRFTTMLKNWLDRSTRPRLQAWSLICSRLTLTCRFSPMPDSRERCNLRWNCLWRVIWSRMLLRIPLFQLSEPGKIIGVLLSLLFVSFNWFDFENILRLYLNFTPLHLCSKISKN